jgi:predicted nucleotidyltransferase
MNLKEFHKVIEIEGLEAAVNSLILQGSVFYFQNDPKKYFQFKNMLSRRLDVHTNNIEIIGSAKLGFSLNQEKLGEAFDKESDIDVAVISDRLFERAWSELISIRDKKWLELTPKERANLTQCQSDVYWGYVSPDKVPGGTEFSKWWWSIFEELSSHADYERRKIRGRLFKSWERAQAYYCYSIQNLLRTFVREGK